jgi:hypothetical protein
MTMKLKIGAGAGLAALVLGACGGGGGSYGGAPPGGPPGGGGSCSSSALENLFGCGFGALFRASANSDPAEPDATGIIALDLTKDPTAAP